MRCALVLALGVLLSGVVLSCDEYSLSDNGVITIFGGQGLGPGHFAYPRAIAIAPDGAAFVVDKTGRVQRFSKEGVYARGWTMPETAAGKPVGLSVHPDGRLFVPDTHYHRVMVYDRDGNLLDSFGSLGTGDSQFQLPTDVAFDDDGFIYVGEYHLNDRVTKWTPDLQFVQTIGEEPIDGKRLSRPAGLVVDDDQTLWVADSCNHRVVRFSLEGKMLSWFGTFGTKPGQMRYPYDLDYSQKQGLLVCEYEGARLQWFSKEGTSLKVWGKPGRKPGELFAPWGAAYGPDGWVYVVDSLNDRVQIIKP